MYVFSKEIFDTPYPKRNPNVGRSILGCINANASTSIDEYLITSGASEKKRVHRSKRKVFFLVKTNITLGPKNEQSKRSRKAERKQKENFNEIATLILVSISKFGAEKRQKMNLGVKAAKTHSYPATTSAARRIAPGRPPRQNARAHQGARRRGLAAGLGGLLETTTTLPRRGSAHKPTAATKSSFLRLF